MLFLSSGPPGKAPPNLAQGVPPLLANQYIMGPGGLLPAYPVTLALKLQEVMLRSALVVAVIITTHPLPVSWSVYTCTCFIVECFSVI